MVAKEEKHQRVDSKAKRNKNGRGRRRLKRIENDDFESLTNCFSNFANDDGAPLSMVLTVVKGRV